MEPDDVLAKELLFERNWCCGVRGGDFEDWLCRRLIGSLIAGVFRENFSRLESCVRIAVRAEGGGGSGSSGEGIASHAPHSNAHPLFCISSG